MTTHSIKPASIKKNSRYFQFQKQYLNPDENLAVHLNPSKLLWHWKQVKFKCQSKIEDENENLKKKIYEEFYYYFMVSSPKKKSSKSSNTTVYELSAK